MSEKSYDILIIGGGPGGYVAAIRAAQLGQKVAVVEKRTKLGGTCLNVGCIPSKALLTASHKFEDATHHMGAMGIEVETPKVNVKKMMEFKDRVINDNAGGIGMLFKKNKIDHIEGTGSFKDSKTVSVKPSGKGKAFTVTAKNIIIATGSKPASLPGIEPDEKSIVTNTGALSLTKVPKHLVVIGGGVIGLEMGEVWRRLGAKVTVVEFTDTIMPGLDGDVIKAMHKMLKDKGMVFQMGHKVTKVDKQKNNLKVTMEPCDGGKSESFSCDAVLVSIGRVPNTEGLALDKAGVELDERGRVKTDKNFRTNVDGIYAIGDVIAGPMLAHKAEEEGVILAEMLDGQSGHIDYNLVPAVVYTHPEAASVGKTEEALKKDGVQYKVGKFMMMANGRARSMNETTGFVKILADKKTDRVLGCHIVAADAGNMIHEVVVAMEFGASSEDIARACHAHPTLNEAVKEAALAVDKRAIHS